jgi:hypothetical protein
MDEEHRHPVKVATSYPVKSLKKTVHFSPEGKTSLVEKGVTIMTISYYAARANLYYLWQHHPEWSHPQFAAALGYSKDWVKKWLKRFREELAEAIPLEEILQGHSRARKHPPPKTDPLVVTEILSIRDQPPEGLRRVPGPEAIYYYLQRSSLLQLFQLPIPSPKTIYRLRHRPMIVSSPHLTNRLISHRNVLRL